MVSESPCAEPFSLPQSMTEILSGRIQDWSSNSPLANPVLDSSAMELLVGRECVVLIVIRRRRTGGCHISFSGAKNSRGRHLGHRRSFHADQAGTWKLPRVSEKEGAGYEGGARTTSSQPSATNIPSPIRRSSKSTNTRSLITTSTTAKLCCPPLDELRLGGWAREHRNQQTEHCKASGIFSVLMLPKTQTMPQLDFDCSSHSNAHMPLPPKRPQRREKSQPQSQGQKQPPKSQ